MNLSLQLKVFAWKSILRESNKWQPYPWYWVLLWPCGWLGILCLHPLAHTQVSFKGCPYKSTSCDECLQTFPTTFLLPCINANRRTKDCVGPGLRLMHSWSCWVHVLLENELNSIWTLNIELFVMFYLSNDGRQKIKALITPPSSWVSAPNSYVWVSTWVQMV